MNFLRKIFSREEEEVVLKAIELKEWLYELGEKNFSGTNERIIKELDNIKDVREKLLVRLDEILQ